MRRVALLASLAACLATTPLDAWRWPVLGQGPIPANTPFRVLATHDGTNTTHYAVAFDGGGESVRVSAAGALANGDATVPVGAGLPAGAHSVIFRAINVTAQGEGLAASAPLAFTIGGGTSDPIPPPGPQGAPGVTQGLPVVPPSSVKINFQPAGVATPTGYLADTGAVFGPRGNGQSYGWLTDNTAQARDRNVIPDQLRDTFNQFQRPANPDAVWELALANGAYDVHAVAGDPSFFDSVFRLAFEGVLVISGTPTATAPFIEGTALVQVSDGRLTVRSAAGGSNNKICFVEITPR